MCLVNPDGTSSRRNSSAVLKKGQMLSDFQARAAIITIYLVIFLDILAVSIFIPQLLARLKELNLPNASVGLILASYGLVQIASCPVIGLIGDTYGRKCTLVICLCITGFSYFILGISSQWFVIFASRVITGFFKQTQLLGKAILSDFASRSRHHELSAVLGNSEAFGSMGFIFGPAIGSYLTSVYYGQGNSDDCFYFLCCISSIIFVVNIGLTAIFIPSTESSETETLLHTDKGEEQLQQQLDDVNQNEIYETSVSNEYIYKKTDGDYNENEYSFEQMVINESNIPDASSTASAANFSCKSKSLESKVPVPIFVAMTFFFCITIHSIREAMPLFIFEKHQVSQVDYGYVISVHAIISTIATFLSGRIISSIYKQRINTVVLHGGILQMISAFAIYLNNVSYPFAWTSLLTLTIANQFLGVGIKALALGNSEKLGSILGLAQTATAVSKTCASILVGLFINDCETVIIFGCISAVVAVLIASIFVKQKSSNLKQMPLKIKPLEFLKQKIS